MASDAPVLVGSLVFVAIVAAAILAAMALTWRAVRRRLRALRRAPAVRTAAAVWAMARPLAASPAPLGRRVAGSLSTARLRRDLWRDVGAAERSVRQAATGGAPVGELPALCHRLHDVALDLDRLLEMGDGLPSGTPEVDGPRSRAVEVTRAAGRIRLAALAAAGDATAARVDDLTGDADREVESLAVGLARARAVLPPSV